MLNRAVASCCGYGAFQRAVEDVVVLIEVADHEVGEQRPMLFGKQTALSSPATHAAFVSPCRNVRNGSKADKPFSYTPSNCQAPDSSFKLLDSDLVENVLPGPSR